MPARLGRPILRTACALLGALALAPASAMASGGGGSGLGTGLTSGSSATGSTAGTEATTTSGISPVSASGDGLTLRTTASAMLRHGLTFSGSAVRAAGRTITIERSGRETHWQWTATAETTVQRGGAFSTTWSTDHIGRYAVRAVIGSATAATGSVHTATAAPAAATAALTVTVFLPTKATLYGPGFYGKKTACGQTLTSTMIGVANRTLPCGEKVALFHNGRMLIVPVIDRGPYANGADWDLTMATGRALGLTGTTELGAVSLPPVPAS